MGLDPYLDLRISLCVGREFVDYRFIVVSLLLAATQVFEKSFQDPGQLDGDHVWCNSYFGSQVSEHYLPVVSPPNHRLLDFGRFGCRFFCIGHFIHFSQPFYPVRKSNFWTSGTYEHILLYLRSSRNSWPDCYRNPEYILRRSLMKPSVSRRDFLKVASTLAVSSLAGATYQALTQARAVSQVSQSPNIIVILLDTLSAVQVSLYGFPRITSPNLAKFAEEATVYHSHHAAGNFTTPSTASFLTGVYPWTHRAFHFSGQVRKEIQARNIFNLIGNGYQRTGFAHNLLANALLFQFDEYIDQHIKLGSFDLLDKTIYDNFFPKDALTAYRSFDQYLFWGDYQGSLYFSLAYTLGNVSDYNAVEAQYKSTYPRGIPGVGNPQLAFIHQPLFDGVMKLLETRRSPFFAYIHLYPPHQPYLPRKEFIGIFQDDWKPAVKKPHFFSKGETNKHLEILRTRYNEYIANTDFELGRLLDHIRKTGLLDSSYVVVTSDHGELFERGVRGHSTPLLYEPILRIPLVISQPGQKQRIDIHDNTSTVDLAPTILSIAGQPVPEWCEGELLPGLGGEASSQRSIYSVEAKSNYAHQPLTKATFSLIKERYKLILYRGYEGYEDIAELYDLKNDPDELDDLSQSNPSLVREFRAELEAKIKEADQSALRQT
jgi:arylsulfatase A-like enzyme